MWVGFMDMRYRNAWRLEAGKEACVQDSPGIGAQDLGPNSAGPGRGQFYSGPETRTKCSQVYNSFILLNLIEPQCPHLQSGITAAPTSQVCE